jgi:hypothetical protein
VIKDTTVHVIDDEDDSENTLSDHHDEGINIDDEPETKTVTSTKSLPPKPKPKSSPISIKKIQICFKNPNLFQQRTKNEIRSNTSHSP